MGGAVNSALCRLRFFVAKEFSLRPEIQCAADWVYLLPVLGLSAEFRRDAEQYSVVCQRFAGASSRQITRAEICLLVLCCLHQA